MSQEVAAVGFILMMVAVIIGCGTHEKGFEGGIWRVIKDGGLVVAGSILAGLVLGLVYLIMFAFTGIFI